MAAVKRVVSTSLWTDGKMDDFSPEDKYFLLYLLTNPFVRQLGIYEISIKQASFQLGYTVDTFNVLLDRFENKYNMIVFSKETSEVAILNFLCHSVISGGKPVEDCIKQDMQRVKNRRLLDIVFARLRDRDERRGDLNITVRKIVADFFRDNDNDNDNDNDSTQGVTGDESPPESSTKKPKKPVKHKHGEYNNVLLTDEELDKLQMDFQDWQARIERLSSYIASTGKKYQSHYATIRYWARMDQERKQQPKQQAQPTRRNGNPFLDIMNEEAGCAHEPGRIFADDGYFEGSIS